MNVRIAMPLLAAALSTGCAAIVSGVNQPITVETRLDGAPLSGAACRLTSNKGTWYVTTPGSIVVHRGYQNLDIECTKAGLQTRNTAIASSTRALAFGNILIGGLIGVGVDVGTGAAYDYPDVITIDMFNGSKGATVSGMPAPIVEPVSTPVVTVAPAPPSVPSSVQLPIVPATGPTPAKKELKYQVSAENFARSRSCSTVPVATLAASGPGFETYTIPCATGDALIARCEYGTCRALQ